MGRKQSDPASLAQALKAPAFTNGDSAGAPRSLDPVSPTTLVLQLSEIDFFEHNPRRAENPEFQRLKDSIASRHGLTTPLTVTRRPGADRYIVASGGNSRLKALKELFADTGDEVFSRINCQFEPWTSDCHVLASHLIENEVRGNMTFADRARAVVQWCELYEASHPDQAPLTQRALVERLCEAGFEISRTSLIRLLSANDYLLAHLPQAFASGLGTKAVDLLLRLRKQAHDYWQNMSEGHEQSPATSFETVFAGACEAQDCHCDDWVHELFVSALSQAIAEALDMDPKAITLDLESLGRGLAIDAGSSLAMQEPDTVSDDGWIFERERVAQRARLERQRARATVPPPSTAELTEVAGIDSSLGSIDERRSRTTATELGSPTELQRVRSVIYAKARELAVWQGLNPLVRDTEIGYGFWIEPPEPPTTLNGVPAWTWWWLASCAQQLSPSHLAALKTRAPGAWLVQLFDRTPEHLPNTDPRTALGALVGTFDLASLGEEFLCSDQVGDELFTALQELFASCRELHRASQRAGVSLWV